MLWKVMCIKLKKRNVQLTERFVLIWYYLPHPHILFYTVEWLKLFTKEKTNIEHKAKAYKSSSTWVQSENYFATLLLSCTFGCIFMGITNTWFYVFYILQTHSTCRFEFYTTFHVLHDQEGTYLCLSTTLVFSFLTSKKLKLNAVLHLECSTSKDTHAHIRIFNKR